MILITCTWRTVMSQDLRVQWEELPIFPCMEPNAERKVKVLLCGDCSVGKTHLACQFTAQGVESKRTSMITTIGIDMQCKTVTVGNRTVKMQIWTMAGQDGCDSTSSKAYKRAEGVVMVYDVTNYATFGSIIQRLITLKDTTSDDMIIAIAGNKVDLESEREVSTEQGRALAQKYGALFFETSAYTNYNVTELFETLAMELMSERHQHQTDGVITLPEGHTNGSTRHRQRC